VASTQLRGWYPDPSGAPRQRYWDGQQWTGHAPERPTLSGKGLWIAVSVIAVFALFFGGCTAMIAAGSKSHVPSADKFRGPTGVPGSALHDGDLEFVVSGVGTPANWRGDPRPKGQWVIVTMTVRNLDDEPQEFAANNQKLIDSDGHVYAADAEAAVSMNKSSMVVPMNPGDSVNMKLPFDVPVGTLPTALELHDSVFSDGVRIRANSA
jgi:Domain of unknown function (DUF4352)/Protein of unknown function (DUF2510)